MPRPTAARIEQLASHEGDVTNTKIHAQIGDHCVDLAYPRGVSSVGFALVENDAANRANFLGQPRALEYPLISTRPVIVRRDLEFATPLRDYPFFEEVDVYTIDAQRNQTNGGVRICCG